MEANEFVAKIKANNTVKDITDLARVFAEFKVILDRLPIKDRASFSLNVLCILCRNLDKAPKWRATIDNKILLTLSIDCVRETRAMNRPDRVKTLACVYHIHRHVVRQNVPIPPELVLKISFMPFELESKHLLHEYSKTYWNLLVDRLTFIERLTSKISIIKLLPKLTEDLLKITEIYDEVQYCKTIIVFIVKKLHSLYNEQHAKELNQTYTQIFQKLAARDMKAFKQLKHDELLEIYVKMNECLYVIAENASKIMFKDSPLDFIVRTIILIIGHSPDLFHCLQTFYSNVFCTILTNNNSLLSYIETVLNSLPAAFDTTEKLGPHWSKAMHATYPFINQFMRLYIEYNVANCSKKPWKNNFNIPVQTACLKLMSVIMERLKNCEQLLKCDNCDVRSGLHDSLRLSFLVKHFLAVSVSQNLVITDFLPEISIIIEKQYQILEELKDLGCANYNKCFRKLQTDIHNTAISLNKANYYGYSIKLFKIYIQHEITESEAKNISRALYNKSICELDSKLYEDALIDAFLSLVFSNDLSSEKYMSLVMDIKAKELKSRSDDEEDKSDGFQMITVVDCCKIAMDRNMYGDIGTVFKNVEFSSLLQHEFEMYSKLWPSVSPIAGVWKTLLALYKGKYTFASENEQALNTLYTVIIQTPTVIRAICGNHFKVIVEELIHNFNGKELTPDRKILLATLLFIEAECDLEAASMKYGWKQTEPLQSLDPDQVPANRSIPQEHVSTSSALRAVHVLTDAASCFNTVSKSLLQYSLHVCQVYVQLLLLFTRDVEGLQLAYHCCCIADCVQDDEAFVRNAGTLLHYGSRSREIEAILRKSVRKVCEETQIMFLCDSAIYHNRCGSVGLAARLVQLAQDRVLAAYETDPDVNLDLAVGRLLEAQAHLCYNSGPSVMTTVNGTQRYYLAMTHTGSKWHTRRLRSLTATLHCLSSSLLTLSLSRSLCAGGGAGGRAAAAAALPRAPAPHRALMYVCVTAADHTEDAQIKIDNRLKHFLGLQPSNETQPYYAVTETKKSQPFTPKQEIETMLENFVFKKSQISPSMPCNDVPAFKIPEFFNHNESCVCYACSNPICFILACETCGLEACTYFKANEMEISRNYFNGVLKMFGYIDKKFDVFKKRYLKVYEGFVVESVMKRYWEMFRKAKVRILIDLAFFELKSSDYVVADEHIVEIHEILQELDNVCVYMRNEIMNLMTCSAQVRKIIKKPTILGIESDLEALKLSPVNTDIEPPKTPDAKPSKPPKMETKVIVKDEELPKRRKVIKLNLDERASEEKEVKKPMKTEFKIPIPLTSRHVLEQATPRTRSHPKILVTQPSDDIPTPCYNITEFCTPKDSTPEQFFTPMTSMKTYTKKSLRRNIVKNLEEEFSTPISEKENNTNNLQESEGTSRRKPKENPQASVSKSKVSSSKEIKEISKRLQEASIKEVSKNKQVCSKDVSKETIKEVSKERLKEVSKDKSSKKEVSNPNCLELPQRSKKRDAVKTLKRATSPGKLCKETRDLKDCNRRLRRPIKLSLDEDDNK